MEDWARFVVGFSRYLFQPGTLPLHLEKMWSCLYIAVEHYIFGWADYTAARRDAAATALWQYAVMVEQYFPTRECTVNLHTVVCR
jgi:hypothetical protein